MHIIIVNVMFGVGIKDSFLVLMSTMYLSSDRRKTRSETQREREREIALYIDCIGERGQRGERGRGLGGGGGEGGRGFKDISLYIKPI